MRYSVSLLKKYISLQDELENITRHLTLKTCEVEEVHQRIIPKTIVIGKCLSTERHPQADKLIVCQVDCGTHWKFQIITGGENIEAGDYVPVAMCGTYMATINLEIQARQMRGLDSIWMICSKGELGINEDEDQHWIWKMQLDISTISDDHLWMPVSQAFPWIESTVFDVDNKTITNRPDLTGHFWLAVELYTIYKLHNKNAIDFSSVNQIVESFNNISYKQLLENSTVSGRGVKVQTPGCSVYTLLQLDNITISQSSFLTRLALYDIDQNPRSNWVDFSNLFMYISGQPVHFFDADKVDGDIIVRNAKQGEEFVDLFDKTHILQEKDIVITDKSKVLALAWVVGGKDSGVSDSTKNVLVEIANFDSVQLRRTATRLGLRTDAEIRFEKYINPAWTIYSVILFMDELKYFGSDLGSYDYKGLQYYVNEEVIQQVGQKTISVNEAALSEFIYGEQRTEVVEKIPSILENLGFRKTSNGYVSPVWRSPDDMNIKEDIYEEIARIYGYESVDAAPIYSQLEEVVYSPDVTINRSLEDYFEKHGVSQLETYPWIDEQMLDLFGKDKSLLFSLKNPVAPELRYMRDTLLFSHIQIIEKNYRVFDRLAYFEYAKIWRVPSTTVDVAQRDGFERSVLWLTVYNKAGQDWKQDSFLQAKGLIEWFLKSQWLSDISFALSDDASFHPKKQAKIYVWDRCIGAIGTVHPLFLDNLKFPSQVVISYAQLDIDAVNELKSKITVSIRQSKYESLSDTIMFKDISLVVDKTASLDQILKQIWLIPEVKEVQVLDIYAGSNIPQDKKSISLTLKIQPEGDSGWTDVNTILFKAVEEAQKLGATLR